MDTLTHGILGGAAAYAAVGGRTPWAALIGVAAGMAPDLDLFIRPNGDPLGGVSYHRFFTHAMIVVPLGAALCALPFLPWRTFAGRTWGVLMAALVAYGTHGLLDAFTSYGTVLGWPFSRARVAFDTISIIDPLFTAVLLVGLVWALIAGKPAASRWALALAGLYLGLGGVQHFRAVKVQRALADMRGHTLVRGRVMPSLGNLNMWNSVYEADGRLYTDSMRLPVLGEPTVRTGSSGQLATLQLLRQRGYDSPAIAKAFDRFSWFADGYTAFDPRSDRLIGDMRYSVQPEKFRALWGLQLPPPSGVGSGSLEANLAVNSASGEVAPNAGTEHDSRDFGQPRLISLENDSRRSMLERMFEALRGRDPLYLPLTDIRRARAL